MSELEQRILDGVTEIVRATVLTFPGHEADVIERLGEHLEAFRAAAHILGVNVDVSGAAAWLATASKQADALEWVTRELQGMGDDLHDVGTATAVRHIFGVSENAINIVMAIIETSGA